MGSLRDCVPMKDISTALENYSVSLDRRGYLVAASGRIDSTAATATYYFQLLNVSSLPTDGTVEFLLTPKKIQHTTGSDSPFDIDIKGEYLTASSGIVWCISTTEFTKTLYTSANIASVDVLCKV